MGYRHDYLNIPNQRIGQTFVTNEGCVGTIVDYKSNTEVYVIFNDYMKPKKCSYINIKSGEVKNPFYPSVCGIGYLGQGEYKACYKNSKGKYVQSQCYMKWQAMLDRCYNTNNKQHRNYKDCVVCEDWHNFQNFAKWYYDNYYEVPNCRMELDKDILVPHNKVYSPDTCVIVPQQINVLFEKGTRSKKYAGVERCGKNGQKYRVTVAQSRIGLYDTQQEAYEAYIRHKKLYVKQIAEQFKDYIPLNVYNAMINYEPRNYEVG